MQNWIPIGVALAVVVYIIAAFNRLVSLRYRVRDAWAQIDVQLKRRHDLIPDSVMDYNTARSTFPRNLVAAPFGFRPADMFALEDAGERATPQVKI
jgi:hypothetical protein